MVEFIVDLVGALPPFCYLLLVQVVKMFGQTFVNPSGLLRHPDDCLYVVTEEEEKKMDRDERGKKEKEKKEQS